MSFTKFPKITQFRHTVDQLKPKTIFDPETKTTSQEKALTLEFCGTVKLHGTNAGVGYSKKHGLWCQSRNRILTEKSDNQNFAKFVQQHRETFEKFFDTFNFSEKEKFVIYGEWCGKGIQKNVAVCELPKRFVIFSMLHVGADNKELWLSVEQIKEHVNSLKSIPESEKEPVKDIDCIYNYPVYYISIDFNDPAASQKDLESVTDDVEKRCPYASANGVNGIGEGVVWRAEHPDLGEIRFKVKGEQHSVTKPKQSTAAIQPEELESINKYVEYVCNENRFQQALDTVIGKRNPKMSDIGNFTQWVVKDIESEENDTVEFNNLNPRICRKQVSSAARKWFMERLK